MRGLGLFRGLRRRRSIISDDGLTLVYDVSNIQTGWTGVRMSIAAAGENDPESGAAASSAYETVDDGSHYVSANIPFTEGVTYRIRTVLKGVGRTAHTVFVTDTPSKYWYAALGGTTALLSSGMSNPTVTDLGGGWYAHAIDFTLTTTSGVKNLRVGACLDPLDTSYPGDVAKGLHIGSVKIYEVA